MNLLFVSIDSLNRHFLKSYGQPIELDVRTPNLDRFAEKSVIFDAHYTGSLPCMPARREYFAGIQEFLWRPWGPMEPFDNTLAQAARKANIVTQLITDHFHYFQHGSHGYYEDYQGFEFVRGHEVDSWKTAPRDPDPTLLQQIVTAQPHKTRYTDRSVYARNVASFTSEEDFFAPKVFASVADWLRDNQDHPQWLLVVDSFDVHEPFHCPEPYASMYTAEEPNDPTLINWPFYGRIDEGQSKLTERQVAFVRAQFAGKMTLVDRWLGKVFQEMDEQNLWESTVVIVTADHGHYLGDHGWMGKPVAPLFNTLTHIPLMIWHPHSPHLGNRVGALTATVDLYATMLESLGLDVSEHVHSRSLLPLLLNAEGTTHREWALYGYWGSTVNVTDGRYTYMQPCHTDRPVYLYSTMMMNPYGWFVPPQVQNDAESGRFLSYTDSPVWRYPAQSYTRHETPLLFDLHQDPGQMNNLAGQNLALETQMRSLLISALQELDAPAEQYHRLGV